MNIQIILCLKPIGIHLRLQHAVYKCAVIKVEKTKASYTLPPAVYVPVLYHSVILTTLQKSKGTSLVGKYKDLVKALVHVWSVMFKF